MEGVNVLSAFVEIQTVRSIEHVQERVRLPCRAPLRRLFPTSPRLRCRIMATATINTGAHGGEYRTQFETPPPANRLRRTPPNRFSQLNGRGLNGALYAKMFIFLISRLDACQRDISG